MDSVGEPRRTLLLGIATLGTVSLQACSPDGDAKPSAAATLVNHDKIAKAMADLNAAVDGLNQAISGFDDDNWRDVVPTVRQAATDVDSAVTTLRYLMSGAAPDQ
jgi:hypothetical protein